MGHCTAIEVERGAHGKSAGARDYQSAAAKGNERVTCRAIVDIPASMLWEWKKENHSKKKDSSAEENEKPAKNYLK